MSTFAALRLTSATWDADEALVAEDLGLIAGGGR